MDSIEAADPRLLVILVTGILMATPLACLIYYKSIARGFRGMMLACFPHILVFVVARSLVTLLSYISPSASDEFWFNTTGGFTYEEIAFFTLYTVCSVGVLATSLRVQKLPKYFVCIQLILLVSNAVAFRELELLVPPS